MIPPRAAHGASQGRETNPFAGAGLLSYPSAMRTLYHLPLSAACRKVRLVLHEKNLEFEARVENTWERRHAFLKLNPAGEVPVLVEVDGTALSGSLVISEFLNEVHGEPDLLGAGPLARAETRRLVRWFDVKFNREVTRNLVGEKVMKRFLMRSQPDSDAIRAGLTNVRHHLDYIGYLVERRKWLAGDQLSLADIAAAAHLSCIDYLGDVPWSDFEAAKDWYAKVKSRPSFRSLLGDALPGVPPARHYANLDF